ncbi:methyl-coenzyme M reductase II subunit gamma, putative [Actinidia rufa]|uniref:Methyl-coenzyme M reductase II subunit gamma, putative n=1 Tax=Actinidia rufa TaxID=165716 RepID=A0A7J0HAP4_9ERIC|nr:methyl-coenzyme M reductase II subunit gamma, putative [Actinidia rufa]
MNGIQNGKTRSLEKPFPGCLGRVVNLFDLSTGVAGNRLLMDKPHRDGSPLSRSQSAEARISPVGDPPEDKVKVSELRRSSSNKASNGTPMKMLIAQEMSKEVQSNHNPPSVVAKLMGLDALPQKQSNSDEQRSQSRDYSQYHSGIPLGYWQQEHGLDVPIQCEVRQYQEQNGCRDVYEIWQQSQGKSYARNKSPQKGRHNEDTNEIKMDFIRQKFIEAKRLSTDAKLRQSKQFQDALDVLSSNKDLFLKFLQEPNALFSQHLCDLQPPPETKRITVLKPSKMVDNNNSIGPGKKNEKRIKKASNAGQVIGRDKSNTGFSPPNWRVDDNPTQPTQIVILKPSPEDDDARESREVAKEITRQMRESLSGHRRDETFLSSVFSNGYIGDESSFSKSEIKYELGNCSDSEVISPTSRHSWDCVNRFGSPYSSSFSRASYSPESSVCQEAKKRLSERWAMMASNGICQEPRHVWRSSSTLGEMLSLSDESFTVKICSCFFSTVFEGRLNIDPGVGKTDISKEVAKDRSVKQSLKGKVSSLFFSRNKKSSKKKSSASQSDNASQKSSGMPVCSPGRISDGTSGCANDTRIEECSLPTFQGSSSKASSPDMIGMGIKQGINSSESGLSVTKPAVHGNPCENQDQPSPISVLEPPFEEEDSATSESCDMKPDDHGAKLSVYSLKSNLIDKSPPIESIARTLSWDNSCVGMATPYPLKPSLVSQGMEEEGEWLLFVESLLSEVGLDCDVQSDSFFARWHSPESPLDPSLREKYIDINDKEIIHEAKRRQRRSMRKLVFDCVNATLVEITGYRWSDTNLTTAPCGGFTNRLSEGASPMLVDEVWTRMREWFSCEARCVSGDGGDNNSLVVERVVRKEVVGKGWTAHLRLETDHMGKEIEVKLLEELVQEAVVELTGKV